MTVGSVCNKQPHGQVQTGMDDKRRASMSIHTHLQRGREREFDRIVRGGASEGRRAVQREG